MRTKTETKLETRAFKPECQSEGDNATKNELNLQINESIQYKQRNNDHTRL
jgi:hypothetical protein